MVLDFEKRALCTLQSVTKVDAVLPMQVPHLLKLAKAVRIKCMWKVRSVSTVRVSKTYPCSGIKKSANKWAYVVTDKNTSVRSAGLSEGTDR